MKQRYVWITFSILLPLLIVSLFLTYGLFDKPPPDVFIGVDVAYDNVEEIKTLVDDAGSYINTIVIGSTGITYNVTKLDEVCQYIYDKGMNFMIYAHPKSDPDELAVQRQWVLNAKPRWGENFLGLYQGLRFSPASTSFSISSSLSSACLSAYCGLSISGNRLNIPFMMTSAWGGQPAR